MADVDLPEPELTKWLHRNTKYSAVWPNIDEQQEPLSDAEDWNGIKNKWEQFIERNT